MTHQFIPTVEYANLAIIDLSTFSTPEGKAELVGLVREAMQTLGFLCVINHGLSREQVRLHFSGSLTWRL